MKLLATIIAAALLLPAYAVADTRARLLVRGNAAPSAEISVQVELSWDGRPEQLLPRVPQVEVPDGGALRLGSTGSKFDGTRSTWWTNGTVTLPDRGGPYVIGPATITAANPAGDSAEYVADARTLGRGRSRSLLGQGLASGVVLALALGGAAWLWRRLLAEESAQSPIAAALLATRAALDAGQSEAAVTEALALHDLLAAHPVGKDYVGSREGLETQRDALRFGGVTDAEDTVRERVAPLLAIAGALE